MLERPSKAACKRPPGRLSGLLLAPVVILIAVLFAIGSPGMAQESGLETRYATVVFNDEGELFEFARKLGGPGSVVSSTNPNLRGHIKESVDRIVFRVKVLLDMHPDTLKFTVRLYPSDRGLRDAYQGLGAFGDPPVAFYSHKSRTIHMGLQNATDRVFAHEVAHAVINSYFTVPPPVQVQEILAQYVDRHLWEN